MRRSPNHAALTDEVARFQADVRRLALAAVHTVLRQELDRRLAKRPPARPRAGLPAPTPTATATATVTTPATAPAAVTPREQPPSPTVTGRKRVPWTREAIIEELATWMSSGTAIDATFVARHGPPGLVAATRRIFGRFEAALNVAGLHVSKLYPDGLPPRGQS